MHWVTGNPKKHSFHCQAKVRYRQKDQDCLVTITEHDALIQFTEAQRAVTPGQSIVFYADNQCLGGGIIQGTDSKGGILQSVIKIPHMESI